MYEKASVSTLSQLLNHFSVPMFAVERKGPDATFRYVCVNDAMASATGRAPALTLGKSVHDLFPSDEAETANGHLLDCARARQTLRFCDRFTTEGRKTLWDTTLQFEPLCGTAERIVGTSIQLHATDLVLPEVATFEDIQYFSTMADFQLQNLVSLFETYRSRDLFRPEAAPRVAKLGGMCRSIQRAVADIKKTVQTAQIQRQPMAFAPDTRDLRHHPTDAYCADTVRALIAYSAEMEASAK